MQNNLWASFQCDSVKSLPCFHLCTFSLTSLSSLSFRPPQIITGLSLLLEENCQNSPNVSEIKKKKTNLILWLDTTGQKQKQKWERWEKADFHICLTSHFTTYTVYNILPCKQQNGLSQALKNKHSDKNNSPTKPDRQAVIKGFFLPLVWGTYP